MAPFICSDRALPLSTQLTLADSGILEPSYLWQSITFYSSGSLCATLQGAPHSSSISSYLNPIKFAS